MTTALDSDGTSHRRPARPTIGFDVAPGTGGPPRYVAALARALESAEWNVVYPLSGDHDRPNHHGNAANGAKPDPRFWRPLASLIPHGVRYVAGFARESWRLSHRIAPHRLDIFHAQNTGCEETPVGARFAGARRVLGTFHVDSTTDLTQARNGYAYRSLEYVSNRCLHRAIAVSEATKRDWVERTRIPQQHVAVIHNGIDTERICRRHSREAARGALKLPQGGMILGGLGRLDPVKGFTYLFEALALLRPQYPQLYLAIGGTGPQREELETKAALLGLADRIVFLGFCRDVNQFLDACDLFVLSSLSEALPFALLEAMAHELAVVGTAVGGVPEVIVPRESGFLVPPRDPAALAIAIRPLLECDEVRHRFGRAGRQRVVKHFHEADMVRRTMDVYRKLLRRQNPATRSESIVVASRDSCNGRQP